MRAQSCSFPAPGERAGLLQLMLDLAADRSGLQTARNAIDPASAGRTMVELGRAGEADLLPRDLLKAPEGLGEATFVNRFGGLDQEHYRRAVTSIDQVLARKRAAAGH